MRTVVAHTADLGPDRLAALERALYEIFGDDYDAVAWDHALGGMHVLVMDGDAIAGHGSVVARRVRHDGRWQRCGYVESVAVAATHRRRGIGVTVMTELERLIRGGYELGGLAASEDGVGLYEHMGWQRWRGPLSELRPEGVVETPGEHAVFVLGVDGPLDADTELTCDWREGESW